MQDVGSSSPSRPEDHAYAQNQNDEAICQKPGREENTPSNEPAHRKHCRTAAEELASGLHATQSGSGNPQPPPSLDSLPLETFHHLISQASFTLVDLKALLQTNRACRSATLSYLSGLTSLKAHTPVVNSNILGRKSKSEPVRSVLAYSTNLEELTLSGNIHPDQLYNLKNLHSLKHLDLSAVANLTNEHLQVLAELQLPLESLKLGGAIEPGQLFNFKVSPL
ncbi:MAG: hypothetical protein HC848_10215 [Limnobacter sp.]|nr:hypothetical protein [Limnobacter sp.]